ncbi:MAG: aminoacetone oxidase family FAD-binding enzyme [Planctomycetia bacterium]|nr:aminoacetone oxidase family FAD-binding enzyme [Planctomycetia bacterium]
MLYDVLILGAGPAGLAAACFSQGKTLLLEKNASAGKKLLLAGSGHCNVTHGGDIRDFFPRYGLHAAFVKPCLMAFPNTALVRWLAEQGVPCVERNDGKIFPRSQNGRDVLNALLTACSGHVKILLSQPVQSVTHDTYFHVATAQETFSAKKLILTTGGQSYPATGSTGDGFRFAQSLGHTLVPPAPALTPIYVRDYTLARCAGISLENVPITLWRDGKKTATHRGDLLLTHTGLSGPGILDFSRNLQPGDTLRLELGQEEPLRACLNTRKEVKNVLSATFQRAENLIETLLVASGVSPSLRGCDVTRGERKAILENVLQPAFVVAKLGGFHEAMVTRGGVRLEEVNRKTMESRLVPGLFFAGEILDIDGDTGGYNLQFAFSSGFLAGKHA